MTWLHSSIRNQTNKFPIYGGPTLPHNICICFIKFDLPRLCQSLICTFLVFRPMKCLLAWQWRGWMLPQCLHSPSIPQVLSCGTYTQTNRPNRLTHLTISTRKPHILYSTKLSLGIILCYERSVVESKTAKLGFCRIISSADRLNELDLDLLLNRCLKLNVTFYNCMFFLKLLKL